jgi:glycosyltransferase involved in cell wall biosynthesis
MPESIRQFSAPNIEVLGFVEDLGPIYARSRAMIAPLRYGAGLKGKIISSLAYGVPCISTTIGIEGSGLLNGRDILVADSADEFSSLIFKVFKSEYIWQKLSKNGIKYFKENYSTEVGYPKIEKLVRSVYHG